MVDHVCIKTYNTRIDAEIDRGVLESQKIQSIILADDEGGMLPLPLGAFGIRLMVRKEDIKSAQEILNE